MGKIKKWGIGITFLPGNILKSACTLIDYDKKHITLLYPNKDHHSTYQKPTTAVKKDNWIFLNRHPENHRELFIYED